MRYCKGPAIERCQDVQRPDGCASRVSTLARQAVARTRKKAVKIRTIGRSASNRHGSQRRVGGVLSEPTGCASRLADADIVAEPYASRLHEGSDPHVILQPSAKAQDSLRSRRHVHRLRLSEITREDDEQEVTSNFDCSDYRLSKPRTWYPCQVACCEPRARIGLPPFDSIRRRCIRSSCDILAVCLRSRHYSQKRP